MPEAKPSATALDRVRKRIDALDEDIQRLIAERAGLAQEVLAAKSQPGVASDLYRPEREAQVLRRIVARNTGPLSNAEMVRLYREIMSACLAQQAPLKVAYLGPEGTFTQAAVFKHFGHSVRDLPWTTIEQVFDELQAGHADFGVVPVENSNEGSVHHTLDMFLSSPVKICGEVELQVHHNLLSNATDQGAIRRVYSHQQSFAQCRGFLREHLPQARRVEVSSNAEAARAVRHVPDAAAIAGSAAAEIYDLPVLMRNIEDHKDNCTRFLVIGQKLFASSGEDKTSLLLSGHDHPGALHALLQPLANNKVSMTRIESRPSKRANWDYVFFVDVDGHVDDANVAAALEQLRPVASMLKILGSYPRAIQV